jgi:hypothetical protein
MRWMQEGEPSVEGLLTHRFPLYGDHQPFAVTADKAKPCSIKMALEMGNQ